MLDKLIDEIVDEYAVVCPHATRDEITEVLRDAKQIIAKNKDATIEEIVDDMIEDCVGNLNNILESVPTPGIMSSLQVGNININLHGGLIRPNGEPLTRDALFDIASISKMYTQIIAYKLINEGAFKLSDKIKDLDPRFENVGDLTVSDVLSFITEFSSNGKIEDADNEENAKDRLFTMTVIQKGEAFNYTDMGLMLMKEVMEAVTGMSYEELFDNYIKKPYRLNDTYLKVPKEKIHLVTGTPNLDGSVNDLKANALGEGYSGHAGIRATSDDLIKLGGHLMSDYELTNGLFIPNPYKSIRSQKMGNAYINPEFIIENGKIKSSGSEKSYFGAFAPSDSVAAQGSTRVISRSSRLPKNNTVINSTALSNIAGMTDEDMYKEIYKENARRLATNPDAKLLDPSALVKERVYGDKSYKMHDPRALMNEDKTLGNYLLGFDNKVVLKLLLLSRLLQERDDYYDDIDIEREITTGRVR